MARRSSRGSPSATGAAPIPRRRPRSMKSGTTCTTRSTSLTGTTRKAQSASSGRWSHLRRVHPRPASGQPGTESTGAISHNTATSPCGRRSKTRTSPTQMVCVSAPAEYITLSSHAASRNDRVARMICRARAPQSNFSEICKWPSTAKAQSGGRPSTLARLSSPGRRAMSSTFS